MPRHLSFATDHVLGNNGFAGRVCGDSIRLGDRFTAEYRIESHINKDDESWSELHFTNPIDLKVLRIKAYNRELREIFSGSTCLIEFKGDISGIAPRALIGDESTRRCHDEMLKRFRRRNATSQEDGSGQPATRSGPE